LDESGFFTKNKKIYMWRHKNEDIYSKIKDRKKLNLIMAVSNQNVIYYEISKENANNNTFKKFMINMINSIDEDKLKNYIFIMDNLSCHLTKELFEFLMFLICVNGI
jgi:uncharacterized pyridoxamine 5'-phosphate oxidase family protein